MGLYACMCICAFVFACIWTFSQKKPECRIRDSFFPAACVCACVCMFVCVLRVRLCISTSLLLDAHQLYASISQTNLYQSIASISRCCCPTFVQLAGHGNSHHGPPRTRCWCVGHLPRGQATRRAGTARRAAAARTFVPSCVHRLSITLPERNSRC